MAHQFSRTSYRHILLAAASLGSVLIAGCGGGSTASFFYVNKNTQAIRRDTVTPAGVTSYVQNPQDSVNGTIRLAPVESLNLQPVQLAAAAPHNQVPFDKPRTMMLPAGYSISVFASGLGRPRSLALREDGTLFVSLIDGTVEAIAPNGTRTTIASDLSSPHGLELHNGSLYYTDETRIFRFDFSSPTAVTGTSTMLTDKVPAGGTHYTRSIRWVQNDKKFYVGVGSTSNKGIEDNNSYGNVLRMSEAGGALEAAARGGLRDVVAMDVHPQTGELWVIDNGTELLSTLLPPTEVNILKVGRHYGWPFFYSQNFPDPGYMDAEAKSSARYPSSPVGPIIELEGHAEAVDMQFYTGTAFGAEWKNAAVITYNGTPKVIRLRSNPDGSNARQADFLTGFIDAEENTWGRPVGIAISGDGRSIYISDDRAGAIYRISKL